MAVEKTRLAPETMKYLCEEYLKNNYIDPETSERLGVKRGLRNPDGTGVLAGLTNVCDVVGYDKTEAGAVVPIPGKLIYRGVNVEKIVEEAYQKDRFMFEEVIWLLLFGTLPTADELSQFCGILESHRALPDSFAEDMIMKAPSPNIMNKLARGVLAMYSYDENPEDLSLENLLEQSISLIAGLPTIMVNAWQVKRRIYDHESMFFHMPIPGQSTAEHILATYRADQKFTHEEAKLLDLCLVLHADHGGGNNSAFTCRVLSSSGTDTYSAIAAAIGSLKGPKHGGANLKVMEQLGHIQAGVQNHTDIDVNADGNADIDMSSVLSFKGLIHFCMGFGWFMYLCQPPYIVLHYLGAVISGSFFVFVLAWIYKLCYKLKQENKPEQGEELIGRKCEIYTRCQEQEQAGTNYVVYIAINGAQRELTVRSIQGKSYREGDILTLKDYKEGIYYID